MRRFSNSYGLYHLPVLASMAMMLWTSVAIAQQGGGSRPPRQTMVDCSSGSLQEAIDRLTEGDAVLFQGTCSEDIVITKDGITVSGDASGLEQQGGDGTVDGSVSVQGADNVSLRFLTVTGSGMDVTDGGDADILGVIVDNSSFGVSVLNASVARITGTAITNNADIGLFVNRNSAVELRCNNTLTGNPTRAVHVEEGGALRQQGCTAPDQPDQIAASGSGDSILAFNGSTVDVRGADVTGPVVVYGNASFRIQSSTLTGDVDATASSLVGFRTSATFVGTLTCDATSGTFGSLFGLGAVACGDTLPAP